MEVSEEPPCHLSVVLDLSPTQWYISSSASEGANSAQQPFSISSDLSHVLAFLNSHLSLKHENTLAVWGAFPKKSVMLYSSSDIKKEDEVEQPRPEDANFYARFKDVDEVLMSRLGEELGSIDTEGKEASIDLVGALTKALCHINKITLLNATTSSPPIDPRILIISVSPDLSTSYIPLMNSIFSAQKLKVVIDVCKIGGEETVFLQQAAHLTGGSYVTVERRDALLQYLLMCFLPSTSIRQVFALPTQDRVDLRAACFCHKNIVDIGYVCSVCLSIFCSPVPVCSTCRTKFPLKTLQRLGFGARPAAPTNGSIANGSPSPRPTP